LNYIFIYFIIKILKFKFGLRYAAYTFIKATDKVYFITYESLNMIITD